MNARAAIRLLLITLVLACLAACAQTAGNWDVMTGDYPAAEAKLQDLLAKDPDNLTLRHRLGMVYFKDGKYADAEKQLDYVLSRREGTPDEQMYYGLSLIGAGQVDKGRNVLHAFTYMEHYRVQEAIRAQADIIPTNDMRAAERQMLDAWNDALYFEQQELRSND